MRISITGIFDVRKIQFEGDFALMPSSQAVYQTSTAPGVMPGESHVLGVLLYGAPEGSGQGRVTKIIGLRERYVTLRVTEFARLNRNRNALGKQGA